MKIVNPSHLFSKIKQDLFPFSAQISLTNRCNEDCIHCLVPKDHPDELNTQELKSIISELRALNCLEVIFTGGEAMLRSDFFELLDFTKGKGMGFRLLSNGTLINEAKIRQLKELSPLDVQISLYGATAKTHDYTTRLRGSFEMTTNALRLLKTNKISFSVTTIVMRHNFYELAKIKEMAKKEKWKTSFDFIIRPRDDGYKGPIKTRISDEQITKAIHLGPLPYLTKGGNLRKYKKSDLFISNIARNHVFISNEGYVFPNIRLRLNCGNLRKDTLKSIWFNSKRLNSLRQLKLEDFECTKCKLYLNCCWEPGLSLLEHNDLFKKPKELCRFMKHITGQKIQCST